MRRKMIIGAVLLTALSVTVVPARATAPEHQAVRTLPPPGTVVGEAALQRGANGASFSFATSGLTKGHVYTIWFVVFNDPENCIDGCNAQEIMDPMLRDAVRAGSLYGAGHVVGGSGHATFSGHRTIGDPADPAKGEVGYPLLDPDAEVHLVIRTHGEKIPGMTSQQLGSFNGGCNPGEPNEGACANLQFATFS